jgi:hypothetical protein
MNMNLSLSIGPLVALIAGILILIIPRLLNFIIAIYLIIVGVLGLFGPAAGGHRADSSDTPSAVVRSASPAGPVLASSARLTPSATFAVHGLPARP